MRQAAGHQLLIVAIAILVLFTNLGGPRLWDRDEPRNAGCAAEMCERSDWVVPVFNGELRVHKPVMLYWLMMSAYYAFGVSEFGARFWSATLAVGTVLATYQIGRRLFNAQVALWAAIILTSTVMFDVASRAATPDSVLIFFSTLPVMVFVCGTFRPADDSQSDLAARLWHPGSFFPRQWWISGLMYGLMGLAVLAKGPVGLVLPTAVIGMFLLIMRLPPAAAEGEAAARGESWLSRVRTLFRPFAPIHFLQTCWAMRPITAIVVAMAVALPWYVWVGVRTDGEWLRGFFLIHNLGRATRAMEGHHGSLLYYPLAILLGFFPWSVLAVPTWLELVQRIRQRHPWHVGYILAACWVAVYVGLFSLARTKLPSYVTPCYPGLALLTGCFVYHWSNGRAVASNFWPKVAFGVLALAGLSMLIGLPIAAHTFLPGDEWLGLLGLVPLTGAAICLWLVARNRLPAAGVVMGVTAIGFVTALFGFVAVQADRHQQSHVVLNTIRSHSDQPHIGAFGCLEPSWVFYAGRPIYELYWGANGPSGKLVNVPASDWRDKGRYDVRDFLAAGKDNFVITTSKQLEQVGPLPPDVVVLGEASYFLRKDRLLVLGRADATARSSSSGTGRTTDLR